MSSVADRDGSGDWYRRGLLENLPSLALLVFITTCAMPAMSCDERKAPPEGDKTSAPGASQPDLGAVKINLVPHEGEPVEVQVRWIPTLPSDEWVPGMAMLINGALVTCGPPKASVDVRFWVRGDLLQVPPDSTAKTQDMTCLYTALQGKELAVAGMQSEHEVLVRIAPKSVEP